MVWFFDDLWTAIVNWFSETFFKLPKGPEATYDKAKIIESTTNATKKDTASNLIMSGDIYDVEKALSIESSATKKNTTSLLSDTNFLKWYNSFIAGRTFDIEGKVDDNSGALKVINEDVNTGLIKVGEVEGHAKQASDYAKTAGDKAISEGMATRTKIGETEKLITDTADQTVTDIFTGFTSAYETFKEGAEEGFGEKTSTAFKEAGDTIAGGFGAGTILGLEKQKEDIKTDIARAGDAIKVAYTKEYGKLPPEASDLATEAGRLMAPIGGFFRDTILKVIIGDADGTVTKAEEAADRYISTVLSFNTTSMLSGIIAEATSFGIIKNVGKMAENINWSLGLGWLSWIVMGTPLQHAIARPMEEKYLRQFMSSKLTKGELGELFTRGLITPKDYFNELHSLGYAPAKRSHIENLNWKIPTASEAVRWYSKGYITRPQAVELLKWQGILGGYAEALLKEKEILESDEPKQLALSQAQQAFSEGIRDEAWFRTQLKRLDYADSVIDVLVELQKAKLEINDKLLSKAQLTSAFQEGVIDRPQFKQGLINYGYSESAAESIIKTEELKMKPKETQLTRADYAKAFRQGVISGQRFREELGKKGYTDQDIDLILINETLNTGGTPKQPSKSNYDQALRQGIITEEDYILALSGLGYDPEDIDFLLILEQSKIKTATKTLTKAELFTAWKYEIIDVVELIERLYEMGYSVNDIEILLGIEEAKGATI